MNIEIVKELLEKKEMEVICATNGKEGLEIFENSKENEKKNLQCSHAARFALHGLWKWKQGSFGASADRCEYQLPREGNLLAGCGGGELRAVGDDG